MRAVALFGIAAAFVMAAIAAFTTPFTVGADALTAVALAFMITAQVVVQLRRRRAGGRPEHSDRPGIARLLPWMAGSCAVIAFELLNYFQAPRRAHPTLSSLADEVTRHASGRSIFFLLWIALGWAIVRRPVRTRRGAHP